MKSFVHSILAFVLSCGIRVSHGDEVFLNDETSITGKIAEMQGGYLLIQLADSNGQASRRIDPERIARIEFSDDTDNLQQRALRRSRFQALLSFNDAGLLIEFLEDRVNAGDSLAALSYAKQWHPKNNYTNLDTLYRKILILASVNSSAPDEAVIHARNWLSLNPKPYPHPLPWEIVATHYLNQEDPETALWISLQPIAHATSQNQSEFDKLKEIASKAYIELGYDQYSTSLLDAAQTPSANNLPPPLDLPSLNNPNLSFSDILKTEIPE